jgi:UrcA family protein
MNMHKTNMWKPRKPRANGLLAMTCLSALIGNVLAASPDGELRQQVVQFADLDVSRPQGITALYGRIASAASQVCELFSERDPSQVVRWHMCMDQAITRAVGHLNIPALTSYYLVKTGRSDVAHRVAKQP